MTDATAEPNLQITFVDASALVALADRDDASHVAAVSAYRELVSSGFRLFTTNLALVQAHELLVAALGAETSRSWLAQCAIHVECVSPADLEEGRRMIEEGSSAERGTLTDTIHLAVLDRLGVTDVFAVDRGFLAMLGYRRTVVLLQGRSHPTTHHDVNPPFSLLRGQTPPLQWRGAWGGEGLGMRGRSGVRAGMPMVWSH
jgi:predicted nucleic acid-binding protein